MTLLFQPHLSRTFLANFCLVLLCHSSTTSLSTFLHIHIFHGSPSHKRWQRGDETEDPEGTRRGIYPKMEDTGTMNRGSCWPRDFTWNGSCNVVTCHPVPRPATGNNPLLSEALPPGRTRPGIRRGSRSHCETAAAAFPRPLFDVCH